MIYDPKASVQTVSEQIIIEGELAQENPWDGVKN